MRNRRLLAVVAMTATILFATATAWACPRGYIPCGERQQLCCPGR